MSPKFTEEEVSSEMARQARLTPTLVELAGRRPGLARELAEEELYRVWRMRRTYDRTEVKILPSHQGHVEIWGFPSPEPDPRGGDLLVRLSRPEAIELAHEMAAELVPDSLPAHEPPPAPTASAARPTGPPGPPRPAGRGPRLPTRAEPPAAPPPAQSAADR